MGIENPVHLIFFAAIALIVLGPKRLPELARAVGKGVREFRESISADPEHDAPLAVIEPSPATSVAIDAPAALLAPPAAPPDAELVAPVVTSDAPTHASGAPSEEAEPPLGDHADGA